MQPNREMQHLLEQADKKIESDIVVLRQAKQEPKKEVPKQKSLGGL